MKNLFKSAIIACTFLMVSCSDDDSNSPQSSNPSNFTVDSYSKVDVDGQLKVEFNQGASRLANAYTVNIIGTPQQVANINVNSSNAVLYISSSNIQLTDGVVVQLWTADLEEIRLNSNQTATFWGITDDELDVVTGGNSTLNLFNIRVANLTCRTQGGSELNVNTWHEDFTTPQTFTEIQGVQINETTLLVDGDHLVIGESVALENGNWTVLGNTITKYFRISFADYITQGNTNVDARFAPTQNININLQGTSEASVWSLNAITGTGQGNSRLFYRPVVGLDVSGFSTQGSAEITPLP